VTSEFWLKKLRELGCKTDHGMITNPDKKISMVRVFFADSSMEILSKGAFSVFTKYPDLLTYYQSRSYKFLPEVVSFDGDALYATESVVCSEIEGDDEFFPKKAPALSMIKISDRIITWDSLWGMDRIEITIPPGKSAAKGT